MAAQSLEAPNRFPAGIGGANRDRFDRRLRPASLAEAQNLFRGYRIGFSIGPAEAEQRAHQIALLTGVAVARRVFLGGVSVAGGLDVPLLVPAARGSTLGEAVRILGAEIAQTGDPAGGQYGFGVRATHAPQKND
jgi:hypothetical protein